MDGHGRLRDRLTPVRHDRRRGPVRGQLRLRRHRQPDEGDQARLGRRRRSGARLHLSRGGRQAAARAEDRRAGPVRVRRGGQHHQAQDRRLRPESGVGRRRQPGVGDRGRQGHLVHLRRRGRPADPQDAHGRHALHRRHGVASRPRQEHRRADPLLHHRRRPHRGPYPGQPGLLHGQRPPGHRAGRGERRHRRPGRPQADPVRRGSRRRATLVAGAARVRRRHEGHLDRARPPGRPRVRPEARPVPVGGPDHRRHRSAAAQRLRLRQQQPRQHE